MLNKIALVLWLAAMVVLGGYIVYLTTPAPLFD